MGIVTKPMELFLTPRSVAIIGASRRTGRGSFNIAEKLLDPGFKGQIYPVNPYMDNILGLRVYPSVEALPLGIDLGIVMVARQNVPRAVADSIRRNIKAFIVITEGFAEADEEGKALQLKLMEIAKENGARIIGPNSLGVIDRFHNYSSSFAVSKSKPNPIAFVCQSGGFLEGFSEFAPGKSIDLGNMCDIDFAEVLEYLEDDPETKIIALHIEGLKDGKTFLQVATRVQRTKPVLVLKAGRSERAAQASASHTGSLSGKSELYHAALKQAGLIQVDNVDELGDITRAFLHLPLLRGNRIAIITPTGGGATVSLDAMEQYGFELAELSESTIDAVKEFFSAWSPPHNPLDVMAPGLRHGYKMVYRVSLESLLEDKNVDAILCIAGSLTLKTIRTIIRGANKPVVTWVLGEWREDWLSQVRETDYQAIYRSPERAFLALAVLRNYSAYGF